MTLLTPDDETEPQVFPPSSEPSPLGEPSVAPTRVHALAVTTDEHGSTTVGEILERHAVRGVVVLHQGRLAFEWYKSSRHRTRSNPCFSVTKSFTGTLAAMAFDEGVLDRRAGVEELLPELASSGFADATVGDVADMTLSVGYREDYDEASDPGGDPSALTFGDYLIALGLEPDGTEVPAGAPRNLRDLLARISRGAGRHGETFDYMTPASDVLGWLLERSTNRPYRDLFHERVWSPVGAEHEAVLSMDPVGTPVMGAGLSMTTRDLARAGAWLGSARAPGEPTLLPDRVLDEIRDGGDPGAFSRNDHYGYMQGYTYHDHWWLPGGPTRPLSAWGIYGQFLWIDPDAGLVIACHAGGDRPSDPRRDLEQDAMCRALTNDATAWP